MNRRLPKRSPLARVGRHVGTIPHGLPTALLFVGAVGALMIGSIVGVSAVMPGRSHPRVQPTTADDNGTSEADVTAAGPGPTTRPSPPSPLRQEDAVTPGVALVSVPGGQGAGQRGDQHVTGAVFGGGSGRGAFAPAGPRRTPGPTPSSGGWWAFHDRHDRGHDHHLDWQAAYAAPTPTPRPTSESRSTPRPTPTPEHRSTSESRSTPRPTPTPEPQDHDADHHSSTPTPAPTPTPHPTPTPEPH